MRISVNISRFSIFSQFPISLTDVPSLKPRGSNFPLGIFAATYFFHPYMCAICILVTLNTVFCFPFLFAGSFYRRPVFLRRLKISFDICKYFICDLWFWNRKQQHLEKIHLHIEPLKNMLLVDSFSIVDDDSSTTPKTKCYRSA